MNRRDFLKVAIAITAFPLTGCSQLLLTGKKNAVDPLHRVRPGDPQWPAEASWKKLRAEVKGRLIKIESPLNICEIKPQGESCKDVFIKMQNPYYISNQPALTQTSGWIDGWTSKPSVYAVTAEESADVVAAVNFAREYNLRLVVKGGAHSYQGRSCSEDSLLIWTRKMNDISLHDAFTPQGCDDTLTPQPAVSIGAGAIWMDAYDAVTTRAGRYVQGGGCTTVGVAGLIQSGGFGSFSKNYGLAAAGLLEAEVVTADGEVRIANACMNPDLFWALKGGGGGSFGVVTRLTLRTRELPEYFGGAFGKIKAKSDAAFRLLISRIVTFYHDRLFNRHWGEQIRFGPDNSVGIQMVFQGLSQDQAQEVWRPFLDWVANQQNLTWEKGPLQVLALPAKHFWNANFLKQYIPQLIVSDNRPEANAGHFYWAGDQGQAEWYLHGYRSTWLSASLLEKDGQSALTDALFSASRYWDVSLHFNKGLAGAPVEELKAAGNTAINPAVLDGFALAIIAGAGAPAFPDIPGYEPDLKVVRRNADVINSAMNELLKVVTQPGSYISESDYFEHNWKQSFWGSNYPKLAAVKKKYDPDGLFFIHHGAGSEEWSDDGFTRRKIK